MASAMGKHLIVGALLAGFASSVFSGCSRQGNTVEATLQCAQLYELKKAKYWADEVGNDKYLFNEPLNTCLALNIHSNVQTGRYFAMVIDMASDKPLLSYSDDPRGTIVDGEKVITCEKRAVHLTYTADGKEIKEAGCDRVDLMNTMFERLNVFGFGP